MVAVEEEAACGLERPVHLDQADGHVGEICRRALAMGNPGRFDDLGNSIVWRLP